MKILVWTSKERVLTAFEHEVPDQVPLFECWIENEIVNALGGDPYTARTRLNLDCLPLGSHPPNTRAYRDGIDEWGRIFENGHYSDGMVKNQKDLEQYTAPLSHAKDWFHPRRIKEARKKYGAEYALYFAWHDCSLGLTYMSLGMEYFFQSLYERPEFVKAVIERSTDWTIALVEQANAAEVDFIVLGDDAAGNSRPFISPMMFREMILPEYRKIIRKAEVPVIWHSDGNVVPLLPMIVDAGFAGIHSLEPKAKVDMAAMKRQYGDKLLLAGNLDATRVLSQSNLDMVRKDVERCMNEGAPGGGYLFSSSNSLFEGHDIGAILEAYLYAKRIGKYSGNT